MHNGSHAHDVRPYLTASETGAAIAAGLVTEDAGSDRDDAAGTGASTGGGRRFLLTGVVSRYQLEPSWNREELREDLQRMIGCSPANWGTARAADGPGSDLAADPGCAAGFLHRSDRQPDDYVVVYLAGHGEILAVGDTGAEHVLLPADAVPADLRRRAVKSADLAEWMLAGTQVRRLLLIVDACYSGMGGLDFARNAVAWAGNSPGSPAPTGRRW